MQRVIILFRPLARYLIFVWIIAILGVSSVPSIPTLKIHVAKTDFRLDYLIHFFEYGILSVMAFLSFADKKFRVSLIKIFIITICLIVFAFLDEYHQKFIPGRSFNPKDLVSNMSGIISALIFCLLIFKKISVKSEKTE